jgi:hypothetical protein
MIPIINRERAQILIDEIAAGCLADRQGKVSFDIGPVQH